MKKKNLLTKLIMGLVILCLAIPSITLYAAPGQNPHLYLRIMQNSDFLQYAEGEKKEQGYGLPVYGSFYLELAQDKNIGNIPSEVILYENEKEIGRFTPKTYERQDDDKSWNKRWIFNILIKPSFGKKFDYYIKAGDYESNHIKVTMPNIDSKHKIEALGSKDDFEVKGGNKYKNCFKVLDNNNTLVKEYALVGTENGLGVKVGDEIKEADVIGFNNLPEDYDIIHTYNNEKYPNTSKDSYRIFIKTMSYDTGFDQYLCKNEPLQPIRISMDPIQNVGIEYVTMEMQAAYLGRFDKKGHLEKNQRNIRVFLTTESNPDVQDKKEFPYNREYSPIAVEVQELSKLLSDMTKADTKKIEKKAVLLKIYNDMEHTLLSEKGKLIDKDSIAHIFGTNGRGKTYGTVSLKIVDENELFQKLGINEGSLEEQENKFQDLRMKDSKKVRDVLLDTSLNWADGFMIDYINFHINSGLDLVEGEYPKVTLGVKDKNSNPVVSYEVDTEGPGYKERIFKNPLVLDSSDQTTLNIEGKSIDSIKYKFITSDTTPKFPKEGLKELDSFYYSYEEGEGRWTVVQHETNIKDINTTFKKIKIDALLGEAGIKNKSYYVAVQIKGKNGTTREIIYGPFKVVDKISHVEGAKPIITKNFIQPQGLSNFEWKINFKTDIKDVKCTIDIENLCKAEMPGLNEKIMKYNLDEVTVILKEKNVAQSTILNKGSLSGENGSYHKDSETQISISLKGDSENVISKDKQYIVKLIIPTYLNSKISYGKIDDDGVPKEGCYLYYANNGTIKPEKVKLVISGNPRLEYAEGEEETEVLYREYPIETKQEEQVKYVEMPRIN